MGFDVLQFVSRVVDQRGQLRPFGGGEALAVDGVDLVPDDAGAVVEDVGEGLVLSMDVAHKVFGALWQRQDGLQIDNLGTDLLHGAELLRQQPQVGILIVDRLLQDCFLLDAKILPLIDPIWL